MRIFNIHNAKTQFSKLVEAASKGEELLIARAGKPAAKLGPIESLPAPRRPGALKGKLRIADDFDAPLPQHILTDFLGK